MTKNAHIIDGRQLAANLKSDLKNQIDSLYKTYGTRPGLAIVRVGDNPASKLYVGMKIKQSKEIGIRCFEYALPDTVSEDSLLSHILEINDDPEMHGMIVQLPLPPHINKQTILSAIDIMKDVDGLHPYNFGRMAQDLDTILKPCTPLGVLHLIKSVKTNLKGLHAVVVGSSNLVGLPAAMMLKQEGCSVTILNSQSQNPAEHARQADILVSATGVPGLITPEWVKPGAVVIDVGIHRDSETDKTVGDVDFEAVSKVAGHLTPVPGGVGPMTVSYLLSNVVQAFYHHVNSRPLDTT